MSYTPYIVLTILFVAPGIAIIVNLWRYFHETIKRLETDKDEVIADRNKWKDLALTGQKMLKEDMAHQLALAFKIKTYRERYDAIRIALWGMPVLASRGTKDIVQTIQAMSAEIARKGRLDPTREVILHRYRQDLVGEEQRHTETLRTLQKVRKERDDLRKAIQEFANLSLGFRTTNDGVKSVFCMQLADGGFLYKSNICSSSREASIEETLTTAVKEMNRLIGHATIEGGE